MFAKMIAQKGIMTFFNYFNFMRMYALENINHFPTTSSYSNINTCAYKDLLIDEDHIRGTELPERLVAFGLKFGTEMLDDNATAILNKHVDNLSIILSYKFTIHWNRVRFVYLSPL